MARYALSLRSAKPVAAGFVAISAIVLAIRAAVPFRFSPFGAETIFWLAICLLVCLRRNREQSSNNAAAGAFAFTALLFAAALIFLAFLRNLTDPFLSDDYILLAQSRVPHIPSLLSLLRTPGGDGSFRPLTALYRQITAMWAGAIPWRWRLIGLAVHLCNSALVFLLSWRIFRSRVAAAVSCMMFGLNGTRPEAVVWIAGQPDLLACACVLTSIVLVTSDEVLNYRRLTVSMLFLTAGILFKESAYGATAVFFGLMMACAAESKKNVRRNMTTGFIGSIIVCAALLGYRWFLFKGPGGYVDPATGRPLILSLHLLSTAKALLLRIWSVLLVPVNWDAPTSVWTASAIAVTMAGVLLLIIPDSERRKLTDVGLAVATAGAVLPAIHLAAIGRSLLGSRILYLPGIPFALWIGSLARGNSRYYRLTAALLVLGTFGVLEHNLAAWHRAAWDARSLCRSAAEKRNPADLPHAPEVREGIYFFRNGFPECVAAAETGVDK